MTDTIPNDPKMIPVIDLFAGGGGFSQGVELSKTHKVVLVIEWWEKGLGLHQVNFPDCDHLCMSLGGDVKEFCDGIRTYLSLKGYTNYLLHGSPPCQSFSNANRAKGHVIADDVRSNLTTWFLEVVKELQPPSFSMENVPGCLKYLKEISHPILKDTDVNIFDSVYGYEFGVPTMRKRLFMGKGFDLSGFTTLYNNKRKRFSDAPVTMIGATHTSPNPFKKLLDDNPGTNPQQFAVRSSTQNMAACKGRGETLNHKCLYEHGENIKTLDQCGFAQLASAQVDLYQQISALATSEDNLNIILDSIQKKHQEKGKDYTRPTNLSSKGIKPGTWKKLRALNFDEVKFIQGFPSTYQIEDVDEVTISYWTSLKDLNNDNPPTTKTIKITDANRQRCIGNSVIPIIAKELCNSMR